MAFQQLPHLAAITRGKGGKAVAFQIIDQQAADSGVVVYDKNVVGFVHGVGEMKK